jgi:hypothetical protein
MPGIASAGICDPDHNLRISKISLNRDHRSRPHNCRNCYSTHRASLHCGSALRAGVVAVKSHEINQE